MEFDPAAANKLIQQFQGARRDESRAVLEGFHAVKHARRFGARFIAVAARSGAPAAELAHRLAPDIKEWLMGCAAEVDGETFRQLSPRPPDTGIIALARRPAFNLEALLDAGGGPAAAPVILLENPSHLGNVGAAVRVAAAAGARGVITTGPHDPWNPAAVRGSAGLHYALPVGRIDGAPALAAASRPLLAIHPEGQPLEAGGIPGDAILAFGSERRGLSRELLGRARGRLRIPMEPGVSSLNLAAAVAVALYAWRLGTGRKSETAEQ